MFVCESQSPVDPSATGSRSKWMLSDRKRISSDHINEQHKNQAFLFLFSISAEYVGCGKGKRLKDYQWWDWWINQNSTIIIIYQQDHRIKYAAILLKRNSHWWLKPHSVTLFNQGYKYCDKCWLLRSRQLKMIITGTDCWFILAFVINIFSLNAGPVCAFDSLRRCLFKTFSQVS